MKKQSHVQTAIKALKRQLDKYEIERDKFEVEENSARASKVFFTNEIAKLDKQIAELEESQPDLTPSELSALRKVSEFDI